VDRDPAVVSSVTDVLRAVGFDVTAARTRHQAVALAQARPPDLVIFELASAVPSVEAFMEALRMIGHKDTPFLALASRWDPAEAPDVSAMLHVPFAGNDLLAAVLDLQALRSGQPQHSQPGGV
jgi:DNA-binding response OmpR family regulator